jgi:hypothetical protein
MAWAFFDSQGKRKSAVSGPATTLDRWHTVNGTGEPAYQNSWVTNVTAAFPMQFRKDPFGRVQIRGTVSGGASGTTIFTLPPGYRPPIAGYLPVIGDSLAAGNGLYISPDGTVMGIRAGAVLYILNVEFDTDTVFQAAGGPAGSLGQPDFDTGWFAESNATAHSATITHNLNLQKPPSAVQWWFSPTAPQTSWYLLNLPNMKLNQAGNAGDVYSNPGSVVWNATSFTYFIYNVANLYSHYTGVWNSYTTGYYRVYLWR